MARPKPRGTRGADPAQQKARHDFPWAEDGQLYARVLKILGNGRVTARCTDGGERVARVRGNMRCREWVRAGDVVLVSLRPDASGKADILFKYNAPEAAYLKRQAALEGLDSDADSDRDDVEFGSDDDVGGI
jgi:translation initiation factor 1A